MEQHRYPDAPEAPGAPVVAPYTAAQNSYHQGSTKNGGFPGRLIYAPSLGALTAVLMSVQTIDDVVSALDTIVQQSYDQASRLGYFAALYRRVTCAVRDGIAAGRFQNGPLMEKLDVVFASRYLDALATFQAGGKATRSWMLAFRGCDDAGLLILQQLLSGMNAHINLDLGIASAQVSPGDQLPQLKPDFDQINNVLAGLISTVASRLPPFLLELAIWKRSACAARRPWSTST